MAAVVRMECKKYTASLQLWLRKCVKVHIDLWHLVIFLYLLIHVLLSLPLILQNVVVFAPSSLNCCYIMHSLELSCTNSFRSHLFFCTPAMKLCPTALWSCEAMWSFFNLWCTNLESPQGISEVSVHVYFQLLIYLYLSLRNFASKICNTEIVWPCSSLKPEFKSFWVEFFFHFSSAIQLLHLK